jgi:hypothetical protein
MQRALAITGFRLSSLSVRPGLCRLVRFVAFNPRHLARNLAPSLLHVVGILKMKKITIRRAKELTQAQVRICGNIARSLDNGVNAVARHANRLSQ